MNHKENLARYTSDAIIIQVPCGRQPNFLFIERKNAPYGYALSGGFRDVLEQYLNHPLVINNTLPIPPSLPNDVLLEEPIVAAKREALEETKCEIVNLSLFQIKDEIDRDPRGYTISHVYYGFTRDEGLASSDAKNIKKVSFDDIEDFLNNNDFAFDHKQIMIDFINSRFFHNIKNKKSIL